MLSAWRLYSQLSALFAECCVLRCFARYLPHRINSSAVQRIAPAEGFDAVYRQIQRIRNPGIYMEIIRCKRIMFSNRVIVPF